MGLGDFFNKAWKWVSDKTRKVVTTVKDAANDVWNGAKDLGKKVAEAIKAGSSKVGGALSTVFNKAESAVKTVYSDVVQKPLGAVEQTWENFSKGFSSPLTWLALGLGAIVVVPIIAGRK
jgi:phage-related protein